MNDRTIAAIHAAGRNDAIRQQAMEIAAKAWVAAILGTDDPDPEGVFEEAFDAALERLRRDHNTSHDEVKA